MENSKEYIRGDLMNLDKFQVRTDLAFESLDLKQLQYANEVIDEEFEQDNLLIKRTVISENVGKEIGKNLGFIMFWIRKQLRLTIMMI